MALLNKVYNYAYLERYAVYSFTSFSVWQFVLTFCETSPKD